MSNKVLDISVRRNMSRTLTEKKVLKKLGIDDFRHLTKEKVITMATMLDKMDPEVAKKALEQFPEFAKVSKDMLKEYKETLDKGLETNRESVQSFYESCNTNIKALQKILEDETLTFEEKKYVIDKLLEISKMMGAKDTENKKFIATMAVVGATALGFATMALSSVLGGNTKIQMSDDKDEEY
ncbi:MAG: hypothetical protein Q4C84_00025 [Bacillota bacterium]|nr:hypothetical protein [Bacillota bacterium]